MKELFQVYPILKEIDEKNDNVISRTVVKRELYAGEQIKKYGDSCMGFMFIVRGEIKIERINDSGKETALYKLSKGELCHEALSCILDCKPLNITGEVIQDALVYILPLDIVSKVMLNNTEFTKYLYMNLYTKMNTIIDAKEEILHEPIEKRLVDFLKSKKSKIIYITHNELAIELGTAREVISRKLKKLEKENYIKLERGKIQLLK